MMTFKGSIDIEALKKSLESMQGNLLNKAEELEDEMAQDIYERMLEKIPTDTGELKESAFNRRENGHRQVGTDAEHSRFVVAQPQKWRKNGRSEYLLEAAQEVTGRDKEKFRERVRELAKGGA